MTVDSQVVSSIGRGVLVFAAVDRDDTPKEVESMAAKVLKMKMWPDDGGGAVSESAQSSQVVAATYTVVTVEAQRSRYQRRGALW